MMIETNPQVIGSRSTFPHVRRSMMLLFLVAFILCPATARAQLAPELRRVPAQLAPEPPNHPGRAAILVEVTDQTELYAANADIVIPPASLTKLVAIHVVMEAVASGETSLEKVLTVPAEAAAAAMPPDSSLMFLDTGQTVTVEELLLGLVVSSGNDAAVATAIHVAGSVGAFVNRMNELVGRMGLERTFFVDVSGLSPLNRTTAREFARFLIAHLRMFPQLRSRLYSVVEFAYPNEANLVPGTTDPTIVQRNRNLLVGSDPRVDGLKTGFIEESGYNIAVSATNGELDLVAVVLGVEAENHTEGGSLRAAAAKALIDYGFSHFIRVRLSSPPVEPVRIWEGRLPEIVPEGAPASIIVPSQAVPQLSGRIFQERETTAPVDADDVLGRVVYEVAGVEYYTVPLLAGQSVAVSGVAHRLWDRIVRMITRGR